MAYLKYFLPLPYACFLLFFWYIQMYQMYMYASPKQFNPQLFWLCPSGHRAALPRSISSFHLHLIYHQSHISSSVFRHVSQLTLTLYSAARFADVTAMTGVVAVPEQKAHQVQQTAPSTSQWRMPEIVMPSQHILTTAPDPLHSQRFRLCTLNRE